MAGDLRDMSIEAGYDLIFYSQLDDDGFPIGGDGVVVAGDQDGSSFLRLYGARTSDLSNPDPEIVTASGDDIPQVTFRFASESLPAGVIEVSPKSLDAIAHTTGYTVTTVAGAKKIVLDVAVDPPQMCLILQRQSKSWESGFRGVRERSGLYVNTCQMTYVGSTYTQRAFEPHRWYVNTSKSSRQLHGVTYVSGTHGVTEAAIEGFNSENVMIGHVFRGNGVQTVFNLPYSPVAPATGGIVVAEAGVELAYTVDYAVAAAVVTFVAPPANNALVNVLMSVARDDVV